MNNQLNLIYMCVFHNQNYINLLKLLITSISVKSNINKKTTNILIITSPSFQPLIEKELSQFNLPIYYYILNLNTLMEASCCKINIFQYENIDLYNKILYLDTDVLINSDVNILFNLEIASDKLYALEEEFIGHEFWGGQFFDFTNTNTNYNKDTSAFSAGVFYFKNSKEIKELFNNIQSHIKEYIYTKKNPIPTCLDQPFVVYNSFIENKYDNQMMIAYLENNPKNINKDKIIYHFPGGPGNYSTKIEKMSNFWEKISKYINN